MANLVVNPPVIPLENKGSGDPYGIATIGRLQGHGIGNPPQNAGSVLSARRELSNLQCRIGEALWRK